MTVGIVCWLVGAAAIAAPSDVQVRRTSPTTMEVTWSASSFNGVAGYRVYYSELALPDDMERWRSVDVGPATVAEVRRLEPHSAYAVRVRAKSVLDARLSNYSDIAYTNRLHHGTRARAAAASVSLAVIQVSGLNPRDGIIIIIIVIDIFRVA